MLVLGKSKEERKRTDFDDTTARCNALVSRRSLKHWYTGNCLIAHVCRRNPIFSSDCRPERDCIGVRLTTPRMLQRPWGILLSTFRPFSQVSHPLGRYEGIFPIRDVVLYWIELRSCTYSLRPNTEFYNAQSGLFLNRQVVENSPLISVKMGNPS